MNPKDLIRPVIREMLQRLVSAYTPNKVILFGSYAYGEPDQDSDINLLIVKATADPFFERLTTVRRIVAGTHPRIPFDPIVLTPEEVEQRLRAGDQLEAAGFFLQQALEKFLKAFLLAKGWSLRRIHDLEALLDEAAVHDPGLEQFRAACQRITGYYLIERDPLVASAGLSETEVRRSLDAVKALIERLRGAS